MKRLFILAITVAILSLHPCGSLAAARGLRADAGTFTGDFDVMLKKRYIRVGVPYSRTLFFNDKGNQRGILSDAMRIFEQELRKRYPGKRPFTVILVPMTFDRLIPSLTEGKVDIAAGRITVTKQRQEVVDFTEATTEPMNEIVVTGPGAPALATLEDLSGKEVHVRASTSYRQSLEALNRRFAAEGRPPVEITLLPDELQDEDVLDMLNAGLIRLTVKDDMIVGLWKPLLPKITPRPDLYVREGGVAAWAIRKDSPKLKALLDKVIVKVRSKGLDRVIFNQFARDARKMRNARDKEDMRRFDRMVDIFRKYGGQYGFDSLLLMAQGYQESRLDQSVKSRVGAVGVMQLMPATGKSLKVGDIHQLEPNIHGGAKYVAMLMDTYFKDANFNEMNRTLFAFASYNAGPARIARIRKLAEKEGFDPNLWFNNVEEVAAAKAGQEPVRYVRNIFKYYVAYKLEEDARAKREKNLPKGASPGGG